MVPRAPSRRRAVKLRPTSRSTVSSGRVGSHFAHGEPPVSGNYAPPGTFMPYIIIYRIAWLQATVRKTKPTSTFASARRSRRTSTRLRSACSPRRASKTTAWKRLSCAYSTSSSSCAPTSGSCVPFGSVSKTRATCTVTSRSRSTSSAFSTASRVNKPYPAIQMPDADPTDDAGPPATYSLAIMLPGAAGKSEDELDGLTAERFETEDGSDVLVVLNGTETPQVRTVQARDESGEKVGLNLPIYPGAAFVVVDGTPVATLTGDGAEWFFDPDGGRFSEEHSPEPLERFLIEAFRERLTELGEELPSTKELLGEADVGGAA